MLIYNNSKLLFLNIFDMYEAIEYLKQGHRIRTYCTLCFKLSSVIQSAVHCWLNIQMTTANLVLVGLRPHQGSDPAHCAAVRKTAAKCFSFFLTVFKPLSSQVMTLTDMVQWRETPVPGWFWFSGLGFLSWTAPFSGDVEGGVCSLGVGALQDVQQPLLHPLSVRPLF